MFPPFSRWPPERCQPLRSGWCARAVYCRTFPYKLSRGIPGNMAAALDPIPGAASAMISLPGAVSPLAERCRCAAGAAARHFLNPRPVFYFWAPGFHGTALEINTRRPSRAVVSCNVTLEDVRAASTKYSRCFRRFRRFCPHRGHHFA